ncbi:MAG: hypothetical protein RLZZ155_732 [Bacteroidota bacterium]|jgi:predicted DNA-binding protein (MmcQ/YjbR family)
MNIEDFFETCQAISEEVTSDLPFNESALVFRIENKIFAMVDLDHFEGGINMKCDPERAIELREQYNGIQPGYYTSKKHWNLVIPNSDVPDKLLKELVQHSFSLVKPKTKKKK